MDTVITVDNAAWYLINPPNMASRPNFFKVRALRLHIAKGLRQIHHPERTALGWSGMAIEPELYALVDILPWVMPTDPGPIVFRSRVRPSIWHVTLKGITPNIKTI